MAPGALLSVLSHRRFSGRLCAPSVSVSFPRESLVLLAFRIGRSWGPISVSPYTSWISTSFDHCFRQSRRPPTFRLKNSSIQEVSTPFWCGAAILSIPVLVHQGRSEAVKKFRNLVEWSGCQGIRTLGRKRAVSQAKVSGGTIKGFGGKGREMEPCHLSEGSRSAT